ncbi:MAG: YfhO family protein [Verrucomicrobiota bacterium]
MTSDQPSAADDPPANPPRAESWFTPGRFALLLGAFLFAAFPRVMLGLDTFFYRDFGVLAYPTVFYHHESFWRGELPLWNPYSNCGVPFLAQWGTMTLYPFSFVYLLLPLPWSLNFFCLAHLFLAGLGMYFLAGRWLGNRWAASVAGTAFVFSGVTLACLVWPNYTVALGWMPWVVLQAERAWSEGGRRVVLAAAIAALQMLSGAPEIVLLTWVLFVGLWITHFIGRGCDRLSMLRRMAALVLVTSGLVAAQLMPFFDLLLHSQRDRAFAPEKWTMPGWGWANFLVPLFHCFQTPQRTFFQYGQEFLSSSYLGASILVFAVLGTAWVRQRRVWLLAAFALCGAILALGENGFVYPRLRELVPVLGFGRYPVKFIFLMAFAIPLLAAYALGAFEESVGPSLASRKAHVTMAGFVALVLIGTILWFARRYPFPYDQWHATFQNAITRVLLLVFTLGFAAQLGSPHAGRGQIYGRWIILILIAVDGMTHIPRQNPTLPASILSPGIWQLAVKAPLPKHGETRAMISPAAEQRLLRSEVSDWSNDFWGKRIALWSNLNLLEGIPKVNGSATLQLREQMEVQALLYSSTNRESPGLMDFLGVSRISAPGKTLDWAARHSFLPLCTVGQKPVFADAAGTLAALTNASFDARKAVYLPRQAEVFVHATNQVSARILSQVVKHHRIQLEVEAEAPTILVIAQSSYHCWRAQVDGRPVPILKANHAFQAVDVPAGRSKVAVIYWDRAFYVGLLISGITLLGCGWRCLR